MYATLVDICSGAIKGRKLGRDWVVLELNYKRKRKPKVKKEKLLK